MKTELPEKANKFYQEYKELCEKHGLMVISEGEQLQIAPINEGEDLWDLKESTIHWYNRFPDAWKEIE